MTTPFTENKFNASGSAAVQSIYLQQKKYSIRCQQPAFTLPAPSELLAGRSARKKAVMRFDKAGVGRNDRLLCRHSSARQLLPKRQGDCFYIAV